MFIKKQSPIQAQRHRVDFWEDLDAGVLEDLSNMLEEVSPFVAAFRQMRDLAGEYLREGRTNVTMGFAAAANSDMRRYNHPSKEEVAAVFVAEDGAPPAYRDLVMWPRDESQPVHRMDDSNEHVDPCTYALLFPFGRVRKCHKTHTPQELTFDSSDDSSYCVCLCRYKKS